tara:strand:+ start:374 stop:580 length:207 start_codon:yes stop_codon:yes gene_type:complete
MKKIKENMSKVELTQEEQANVEAKRIENKKISIVAEQIQKILVDNKVQLQVNPQSRLNSLEIIIAPLR